MFSLLNYPGIVAQCAVLVKDFIRNFSLPFSRIFLARQEYLSSEGEKMLTQGEGDCPGSLPEPSCIPGPSAGKDLRLDHALVHLKLLQ